jgi:hexosaminidase
MNAALVPQPRQGEGLPGALVLTSPVRVHADDQWREIVEIFASDLDASVGWDVVRVTDDQQCHIQLHYDAAHAPEDYTLHVGDRVVISASSAAGFAHGLTTLRQLGPAQLWSNQRTLLDHWSLEKVDIADGPAFEWRGAHLDVARHFFGVGAILRLIDLLAAHKMNRLHLHLNDDQGWRVEVPTWPRLTQVGAMRSGSPVGHKRDDVRDDVPHGGFFSTSDVAVIVEHARRRHVQVIPEIDLPGHAQAVLAAYPEFGNTDQVHEVWTNWGISDHVLNVEPATLDFAQEVVEYVARLFQGSPVHIGGDECPTSEWEASERAQAVMARERFDDVRQLQGLYTRRLAQALQREGREVLAWDEVLDAEVTPGTTIVAWRSVEKGIEAAQRGLDVVMAPMQYLYLDWLSSDAPDEPVAVKTLPHFTTWEKIYDFDVVPKDLDPSATPRIRGAQVQLWTEYIDSLDRLDYMAFPRLSAFSEVAWGTARDVREFRPRLQCHLERLDAMGVSYRPLDATP